MKIPLRYLPKQLNKKDAQAQLKMLRKSRKMYPKQIYALRHKKLSSFKSKKSNHILNARKLYQLDSITPNKELAKKTGCTLSALKEIVKKGQGAYFSSGSRPNQTPTSWGLARLASALTSGKAAAVDYDIIKRGCNHTKRAFRLATKAKNMYNTGHGATKKITV